MNTVRGVFTVRFLRNGDQIFLDKSIINQNGDGAALVQIYEPTTDSVTPDWTVAGNQPIIKVSARSASHHTVRINSVAWAFAGSDIEFGPITATSWEDAEEVTCNRVKFKCIKDSDGYYYLRICSNVASRSVTTNTQITFTINFTSNSISDSITSNVDINIQRAGSNSHSVQIVTNNRILDSDNPSTVLTAMCYYGTSQITVGSEGYSVKWYQDDKPMSVTTASITVDREMVSGGSHFRVELLKNGAKVASDGETIADIADEYQLRFTTVSGKSDVISVGQSAYRRVQLLKNGELVSGSITYKWVIYNAEGIKTYESSGTGSNGVEIELNPDAAKCGDGTDNEYFADVELSVQVDM